MNRWQYLAIFCLFFSLGYLFIGFGPKLGTLEISSPLDKAIPFIPAFIVFYIAGDVYLFLAFFMLNDRKLTHFFIGSLIITSIAFLFFILLPIKLQKSYEYSGFAGSIAALYHSYDTPYNNFPSLHVAYTIYAWLALWIEKRKIALWTAPLALGIIASVLFVKAHLIIDVIGGFALGIGVFLWWKVKAARAEAPVQAGQ